MFIHFWFADGEVKKCTFIMADLSLEAVVGIVVGAVVLILLGGIVVICITSRGSNKRNSTNLQDLVIMRKKRSLRKPVYSGRFGYSDNFDDVPPPRRSNETDANVESFVFDGNVITTRESYDRPYISNNLEKTDTMTLNTVGNYGQVSMISYGGARTSSYRVSSAELEWLEDSQTNLIPKRNSHLSTRPPAPIPTNKPNILHLNRRPSEYMSRPTSIQERPDSFRSSAAVDLGAQHQKDAILLEQGSKLTPRSTSTVRVYKELGV